MAGPHPGCSRAVVVGLRVSLVAAALALGTVPSAVAAALSPSQAAKHVGETIDVVGTAESVVCSPMACLLSFEAGFSGLVVAIPGDAVAAFPDPEASYEGKQVRVHGRVAERNGRPRIEIRDPASISIKGGDARAGAAPAAVAGRRIVSTRSSVGQPAAAQGGPSGEEGEPAARSGATSVEGLEAETPTAAGAQAMGGAPEAAVVGGAPGSDLGATSASASAPGADVAEERYAGRSRSRLVTSGAPGSGAGARAYGAGGRVRVDVAPPAPASLSGEEAAARLGLPADDAVDDGGAPLGGAGEIALLRREIATLVERLGEVEGAIGELADRVAGLEDLAAPAIAERRARAESVGVAPVPAAGPPGLHRVRRGFSAKQVLRLLGEPLQVESNPNGQFTWRYDGGRVVTIDAGGEVISAIGF